MATVVTLANLPTNPVDTVIHRFATGDFQLQQVAKDQSGALAADYVFAAGSSSTETVASFRVLVDKDGTRRNSLKLRTTQTVTVDSIVTEVAPVEVNISWVTPGPYEDASAIMKMIGCAFGLTHKTLSTKVPQNDVLNPVNKTLLQSLIP